MNLSRKKERGSVIFFILIGVVLFAALSYTVAQMMGGGNPEIISEQKADLYADEIIGYARSLRQAVQTARINGCADMDISFDNKAVAGYAHAPDVADACKIFGTGGMNYLVPSPEWLDSTYAGADYYGEWFFPAGVCVPGIGTGDTNACKSDGEDNEELIVFLPYLKGKVCEQINLALHVIEPGEALMAEAGNAWPVAVSKFTGAESDGESLDQGNQMNGCFPGSGIPALNSWTFFQVLLPR